MAIVAMHLDKRGLLNYAAVGREAKKDVRDIMRGVVNEGRKTARGLVSTQFHRRTGKLHKQARGIRTNVKVFPGEVSGSVGPMPNLSNIFEKGAVVPARTIAPKRAAVLRFLSKTGEPVFVRGQVTVPGFRLAPRPTKAPTLAHMARVGAKSFDVLLEKIARR